MTQLVELQKILVPLRAAGFEPFAISNDTVERLRDFADRYAIDFPLLSDEDSAVIRRFGILNTLIEPHEGRSMRWYGIPYPGTYVTDTRGTIVDKEFEQHHARRASGTTLLHRLTGTIAEPDSATPRAVGGIGDATLSVHLSDPVLRLEVISTLVCDIAIAPGSHIYGPGAPDAFMPTTLDILAPGVQLGPVQWPETTTLMMKPLDLEIPVWTETIRATVPITATSELIRLGHGLDTTEIEVKVKLRYQACDEVACGLPQEAAVGLTLPLGNLVEPEGVKIYVQRVEEGE